MHTFTQPSEAAPEMTALFNACSFKKENTTQHVHADENTHTRAHTHTHTNTHTHTHTHVKQAGADFISSSGDTTQQLTVYRVMKHLDSPVTAIC